MLRHVRTENAVKRAIDENDLSLPQQVVQGGQQFVERVATVAHARYLLL